MNCKDSILGNRELPGTGYRSTNRYSLLPGVADCGGVCIRGCVADKTVALNLVLGVT